MDTSGIAPGTLLDDEFLIEQAISTSAGDSYLARRERDGRNVVVQFFTPRTPQLLEQFLQHAQSASRIRHPALASVQGFGRYGADACFLVSEYVQGQKLDEWADEVGIPPLVQVIELVRRLGLGLQAAARAGLTHAALEPSHVIVLKPTPGPDPRLPVKLLDLGLPAFLRPQPLPAEAVRFMAPEALRGLSNQAYTTGFQCTGAMNVYSCGCILYYLCTGGPPYPGATIEDLLSAHSAGRLAPPVRINPEISPALNGVILRALALEPGGRFASVAGLVDALGTAGVSMRASKSMRLTGSVSLVPDPVQEPISEPPPVDEVEEAPTFRTTRPPELFADQHGSGNSEAPTIPPLAMPNGTAQPAGGAPIGLFSSAPPEHERRSPLPPPPPGLPSERPTPLALFSEPPSARHSQPGVVVAPAHPTTSRIVNPYEGKLARGRRLGRRVLVQFAWPLAACACVAAYFVVRLLLVPTAEPMATSMPAADSGETQRSPASPAVEPSPNKAPPETAAAPGAHTGAVIAAPAPTPSPTPIATPLAVQPRATTPERSRERERGRARGSHGIRETRANTNAEANAPQSSETATPPQQDVLSVEPKSEPAPAPVETIPSYDVPDPNGAAPSTKPKREATIASAEPKPARSSASAEPRPVRSQEPQPAPTGPLRASSSINAVAVHGSLPTSLVRRAIERIRPQLDACYARSAERAGRNAFGELSVEVKIDERGRARDPQAVGSALPQLNGCVAQATLRVVSEKAPDTGTVSVSFKVNFAP